MIKTFYFFKKGATVIPVPRGRFHWTGMNQESTRSFFDWHQRIKDQVLPWPDGYRYIQPVTDFEFPVLESVMRPYVGNTAQYFWYELPLDTGFFGFIAEYKDLAGWPAGKHV